MVGTLNPLIGTTTPRSQSLEFIKTGTNNRHKKGVRGSFSNNMTIKSVQKATITIANSTASNTATISTVDTTRSVVFFNGCTTTNTTAFDASFAYVDLTNATTVTATRSTSAVATAITVEVTVVEFYSTFVDSVQQGTVAITSTNTSATATITAIDTARSAVVMQGFMATSTGLASCLPTIVLTNSTTVTANRTGSLSSTLTVGFTVIQFASGVVNSVRLVSVSSSTTATTVTATITSVNTANSIVLWNGQQENSTSYIDTALNYVDLTNSTTVTFTRTNGTSSPSRTLKATVVEFKSGIIKSKQTGTTVLNNVTSNTSTVTSVDTSKSLLNWCAFSYSGTSSDFRSAMASAVLTNATTITAAKNTAGTNTSTPAWELVEFN